MEGTMAEVVVVVKEEGLMGAILMTPLAGKTDTQTHRQTHRQTDRQTDVQTGRQTQRQTHRTSGRWSCGLEA
jgi:hypothetical protein